MQITTHELHGEQVRTIRIVEPILGSELAQGIHSALNGSDGEHTTVVFLFDGHPSSTVADFPSFRRDAKRVDMRYFGRWEELIANISRLKARTFAAYRGSVGAAAVQLGLVADLRLASTAARLHFPRVSMECFPSATLYWLPKFVGLGMARRLLLLGGEIEAGEAARIGLLDIVGPDLAAVVEGAVENLCHVTPEAACFVRRITDDSYRHERMSAIEQIKAARYKLGTPEIGNER